MVNIVFSPEAHRDLLEIGDYVAFKLHNKSTARKLIDRIQKSVLVLRQFPESRSPLDDTGPHILYRYLICGNYMIFYHPSGDRVCIDRILYGRRDYLSILFGDELSEE